MFISFSIYVWSFPLISSCFDASFQVFSSLFLRLRLEVLALLELSRRSFEDGEDLAQLELGLQRGKEAKAMARELNDRRLEATRQRAKESKS